MMNILVIAPHHDDEVLGCGGTIAKFCKEKNNVYVAILTKGCSPLYADEKVEEVRMHTLKSHRYLGIKDTLFCDFPAAKLDMVHHADVNKKLSDLVIQLNPDMMFIPFSSDIHLDHQCVFLSSLVAARPNRPVYPKKIYAYETLSETNWNAPYLTSAFHPNAFIDISDYLKMKLIAFSMHREQAKEFPHERSLKTIEALATLRGSTVHRTAAEAFVIIREVL